ncbi:MULTISPECIES: copper-binding protein [unclassified Bradyrhizobium]|uniref:copper-binding protein n=1 Tax=unclassified Bradyrhizobium TaxID=2631580 RepID=UPI00247AFD23|nr:MULTISPECIES: copper-binding protein [unclassified Bradyrhizobium]WGS22983.1 copper-binding protein [Bradyrhizobium sp. ISRA463]WGS29985.1 copper-binding protein [Bradyrhizobium sp. ISRA464]
MNRIINNARALLLAVAFLATSAAAQDASINGEVKKIDQGAGKITLKHGPAPSLGMDEGMTMAYRVKDPAMLKQVKVGDKVKFEADNGDSGYTVTKLQKSK